MNSFVTGLIAAGFAIAAALGMRVTGQEIPDGWVFIVFMLMLILLEIDKLKDSR